MGPALKDRFPNCSVVVDRRADCAVVRRASWHRPTDVRSSVVLILPFAHVCCGRCYPAFHTPTSDCTDRFKPAIPLGTSPLGDSNHLFFSCGP